MDTELWTSYFLSSYSLAPISRDAAMISGYGVSHTSTNPIW